MQGCELICCRWKWNYQPQKNTFSPSQKIKWSPLASSWFVSNRTYFITKYYKVYSRDAERGCVRVSNVVLQLPIYTKTKTVFFCGAGYLCIFIHTFWNSKPDLKVRISLFVTKYIIKLTRTYIFIEIINKKLKFPEINWQLYKLHNYILFYFIFCSFILFLRFFLRFFPVLFSSLWVWVWGGGGGVNCIKFIWQ